MVLPVNLMEMHIPVFALNIIRESIVNSIQTLARTIHVPMVPLVSRPEAQHTFVYAVLVTLEQRDKLITNALVIHV